MDGRAVAAAGGARRPSRGAAGAAAAAAATPSGSREYRDGGTGRWPWGWGRRGGDCGTGARRGEGGGEGTEPKGPYGRARGLGPASPPLVPRAWFIVLIPLIDAFSPRSPPLSSRLTGRPGSAAPGSRQRQVRHCRGRGDLGGGGPRYRGWRAQPCLGTEGAAVGAELGPRRER